MGARGELSPAGGGPHNGKGASPFTLTVNSAGRPVRLSGPLREVLSKSGSKRNIPRLSELVSPADVVRLRGLAGPWDGSPACTTLHLRNASGEAIAFHVLSSTPKQNGSIDLALEETRGQDTSSGTGPESILRILLDHSSGSQMLLDTAFRIVSFNRVANERTQATLGKTLREGMDYTELAPPSARSGTRRFLEGVLKGEEHVMVHNPSGAEKGPYIEVHHRPAREGARTIGIHVEAYDVTVRVLAERARDEREAALRALIDNMSEVVWSMDRDLRLLDCNKAFLYYAKLVTGMDIEPGMSAKDVLGPEKLASFMAIAKDVLSGTPVQFEDVHDIGGNTFYFDVNANPIMLGDVIMGISVFSKNVTQRKLEYLHMEELKDQAEKSLRDLDRLLESSPALILTMRTDGTILTANPVSHTLLGIDPEALGGRPISDLVGKGHRKKMKDLLRHTATNGATASVELDLTSPDGRDVAMVWTASYDPETATVHAAGVDITPLRASEARQAHILDTVTDGFMTLDDTLCITYLNPAGERILNASPGLIGLRPAEAFPILRESALNDVCKATMDDGRMRSTELFLGDRSIWVEAGIHRAEEGLTICFRDITESKILRTLTQLERETLASITDRRIMLPDILDRLLLGVEDLLPSTYCSVQEAGPDDRLHFLSAPSMPLEYTMELNGLEMANGKSSLGAAAFLRTPIIVEDIATDQRWTDDHALAGRYGLRACWVFPIIADDGQVLGTLTHYYLTPKAPSYTEGLVTERVRLHIALLLSMRRNAEALRLANERYALAARATNDTLWDRDLVLGTLRWGVANGKRDHDKAAMDERTWKRRVHPDDIGHVVRSMEQALHERNTALWECEYRIELGGGHYRHVLDRGMILRGDDGRALRMVGAMRDITDRKEEEIKLLELNNELRKHAHELELSNTELERFAYVASHDLQEPLRMVTSFMDLLEKRYKEQLDDRGREYIRFAVDGAMRMRHLLDDLLVYSRVDTSQDPFADVDMTEVLGQARNSLMREFSETGAEVGYEGLPVVYARRTQMIQLVQHLLSNALRYRSGREPRVHIEASDEGTHWHFRFQDNGVGIDQCHWERIFIIFQRLTPGNVERSSGVGLSVCKKIVELHGGRIWVDSMPGQGSTFHFTIAKKADAG